MDNNNVFDIKGFYPTPHSLINKMLSGVDWKYINSVLEPSAGSGSIVEKVIDKLKYSRSSYYNKETKWDIDCIELNQNLRYVLQGKNYRVVHDDYLSFQSFKKYDLIVMNPDFETGDKHLLKALDMQESGGKIVCLLNAETLKNPYSNTRKDLVRKLEDYNADIEYIQNAFYNAERKTDVEVALIRIDIEEPENDSIILDNLKKQERYRFNNDSQNKYTNQMVNADYIKGVVQQYEFEVKAGLKLISEWQSLNSVMLKGISLGIICDREDDSKLGLHNSYVKHVRAKYWNTLFTNDEFMGLFTSNLRRKYMEKINELCDYDFSLYNVYTIRIQLSNEMIKGVTETILALFDEFSVQSSWSPEYGKNIHYYDGWVTNKCWKINEKKVIIRLNGYGYWGEKLDYSYKVSDKLLDIEKVFNYLSTGTDIEINEIDMKDALKFAQDYGETKKIELTYFYCTFYKKQTCHLEWKYTELIHRFNIFAGQNKNNLPPSYGKKVYTEMSKEEQSVINSFEGMESYNKVMNNKNNYIIETSKILSIA